MDSWKSWELWKAARGTVKVRKGYDWDDEVEGRLCEMVEEAGKELEWVYQ